MVIVILVFFYCSFITDNMHALRVEQFIFKWNYKTLQLLNIMKPEKETNYKTSCNESVIEYFWQSDDRAFLKYFAIITQSKKKKHFGVIFDYFFGDNLC